jgi:hypothetical protein
MFWLVWDIIDVVCSVQANTQSIYLLKELF